MHVTVRAFALIVVPAAIYLGVLYVHFAILNESGPGDGFYEQQIPSFH